jgi:transmembrane protein EpsG
MIPYYIILLLMIFWYDDHKKVYQYLFLILLLLLATIRNESVGTDYSEYINAYNRKFNIFLNYDYRLIIDYFSLSGINLHETRQLEPLWLAITYLVQLMGGSYYVLNFIIIFLVLLVYSYTFNKKSTHPSFSLLLYYSLFYYFISFNTIRQSVAYAFIILAYSYFQDKKWSLVIIYFTIAFLFHFTAIYALFVLIIPFIKLKLKTTYLLLILSFAIGFSFRGIFQNNYFQNTIYYFYFNAEKLPIDIYITSFSFILQMLLYYIVTNMNKKHFSTCIFSQIWFWGLLFQNLFLNYIWIHRIIDYFLVAQLIAIPLYLPKYLPNYFSKYFYNLKINKHVALIMLLVILLFAFNIFFNRQGVVPYKIMDL